MRSTITNPKAVLCALANAELCASDDDERPALQCVELDADHDRIRVVSTDSYVLLVQELKVAVAPALVGLPGRGEWQALVHAGDLHLVRALLKGVKDASVEFELVETDDEDHDGRALAARVDDREVMLPLAAWDFPKWEQLTQDETKARRELTLASGVVRRVGSLRLPGTDPNSIALEWHLSTDRKPVAFAHRNEDPDLTWTGLLMPLTGPGGGMIDTEDAP